MIDDGASTMKKVCAVVKTMLKNEKRRNRGKMQTCLLMRIFKMRLLKVLLRYSIGLLVCASFFGPRWDLLHNFHINV